MIIIVCGLLGTGKTLLLAYFASIEKKQKIYANFNLKLKNFKRISPQELENLFEGLIEIDEAYSWFDSRTSNSTENRYLTNRLAFNSRKRGLTVIISAQLLSSVDVRFRKLAEFVILSAGYNKKLDGFVYYITDRFATKRFILPMKIAEKLFKIYDTLEVETDSIPNEFEPDRLNKYLDSFVEIVEKEYGEKAYELSKNMINDILVKKGKTVPSRRIVEMIYARLKVKKLEV